MPSAAKAYKGMGMEGWVARWYAANTGKDLSDFTAQARKLAASLAPEAAVLEIAPGPGYFAIELARAGNFRITGLDISATFGDLALIIDLRKDVSKEAIDAEVATLKQSPLNAFFTKWTFRLMLVKRAYTKDQFVDFIRQTQFT